MLECATCGNPVEAGVTMCPFCDRPVGGAGRGAVRAAKGAPRPKAFPRAKVVNIKVDLPTVAEARAMLEREVATARQAGVKVLKVVHGYGSSGVGGGIGRMARSMAQELKSRGLVNMVVPGEQFDRGSACGRQIVGSFPWLVDDRDFGKGNRGVTVLTLK